MLLSKLSLNTFSKYLITLLMSALFISPAFSKPPSIVAAALQAHNNVRAKDGQRPLQWSTDLEKISQQWADKLTKSCKMYHHQGELPFGENLFISTAPTTVNHAVSAWANEKNFYNYKQNKCQAGKMCGHYTQIVWKGTTDVGCGVQSCSNGSQIYVCAYFPAGNIVGGRPY